LDQKEEVREREAFKRIIEQTFCFVAAYYDGHIIGMGRAISDGTSDAYIQDVAVLKKYRGQGLGKQIINKILDHLKGIPTLRWIGLIAEPGTTPFYEGLGFKEMKDYRPMLYGGFKK
jgi:aralkylamine N-acetyltransferase